MLVHSKRGVDACQDEELRAKHRGYVIKGTEGMYRIADRRASTSLVLKSAMGKNGHIGV